MMRTTFKAVAVAGIAAASMGTATASAADTGNNGVAAGIAAYKAAYPKLSDAQARAAAAGSDARRAVYDAAAADAATFGGAWFDPATGLVHLNATTDAAVKRDGALGKQYAVAVNVHKVKRSAADLEADAAKIRAGKDELGKAAAGNVGVDVVSNEVVVALPSDRKAALASPASARGAKVVTASSKAPELDADCTARNTCDWTIRAGIVMWRGTTTSNTPWCSVGFTGRNSSGTRFVLTAGHCTTGIGVNWGTWNQNIGPMGNSVDSGVVDTSAIQVTNSWFTGDSGGQIYVNPGISGCCDLKGVAPTVGYMVAGETVCLSANFTQPTVNGNSCGVLGTNSDAGVRGMARVDGLDACGGDSGGGWYWLSSSGNRYAYGIHSRSDTGCHGDSGGTHSWYTPVASAKADANFSAINIETRP
jgi:streptogrisin C